MNLFGRSSELAEIEGLLAKARGRDSGALVLVGETGIGKSALLDWAAASATDMRVLHGIGIESEAELPFGALQLLFRNDQDLVDALPEPQATALRAAFGRAPFNAGDRFQVGLGTRNLLARMAEQTPVLCLIDDAQWLDWASADAMCIAARRLGSEGVAVMLAIRDDPHSVPVQGLPELRPSRLDASTARRLLAERAADLSAEEHDRVIEHASGNPLALIELPRTMFSGRPTFGFDTLSPPGRVQRAFQERIGRLSDASRTLLAVAAADDTGDLQVLVNAARMMEVPLAALEAAEREDFVTLARTGYRFRHPLIRAAAYRGVPLTTRLAVHRAIADVHGQSGDLDRRTWHLAAAAIGADESVAGELERAAEHAAAHDGYPAAMAAYERAALLSVDPADAARRWIAAGDAALAACQWTQSQRMAERAARICDDKMVRSRTALIRAAVESEQGSPRSAGRILLTEAEPGDDVEADALLLAEAACHARHGGDREAVREIAARFTELALDTCHPLYPCGVVPRALAALSDMDIATALGTLRELREPIERLPVRLRILAADAALLSGQDEPMADLAAGLAFTCRHQGRVRLLSHALQIQAQAQLFLGAYEDAQSLAEDALRIACDTGQSQRAAQLRGLSAWLAAIRGEEERCLTLVAGARAASGGPAQVWVATALALLDIGTGRYAEAAERLHALCAGSGGCATMAIFALPDLVEAVIRAGRPDLATEPLARWEQYARHSDCAWAQAVAARCRALSADGDTAEEHYAEATRLHRAGGRPFERGRTELLFGEWLRRERRRVDARRHLRAALDTFDRLDAAPWAERARMELRATGESVRHAGEAELYSRLTPQELEIVRLAAAGDSNKKIGAKLFLSHRTVAYHLYKAFPKLGIASRAELRLLDLEETPPAQGSELDRKPTVT